MEQEQFQPQQKKSLKNRVKVAIRVRPISTKELLNNDSSAVACSQNSHREITIGQDRQFKFDHVFSTSSHQQQIYQTCVKDLVLGCFQGYNAAILAYGQTGSGKTYTMGTAVGYSDEAGIIPRVISEVFQQVNKQKEKAEIRIKVSFIEIYNQQIHDLLAGELYGKGGGIGHGNNRQNALMNRDNGISIREEKDGSVSIMGVCEENVDNPKEMMELLEKGSFHRQKGKTNMNDESSRSHAIFTLFIEKHILNTESSKEQTDKKSEQIDSYTSSKFFFVDLAGSERAKKTGATGIRLKEGISINLGLLQLGNVISALSADKKHDQYITYRNSKLTRILQDCLGGNSNTYMLACVSPAQSNYEQSLNTLKYASKAMNIKNKPVVNRDPMTQMRARLAELETENSKLKKLLGEKGVVFKREKQDNLREGYDHEYKKTNQTVKLMQKQLQELNNELLHETKRRNQLQIGNFQLTREKDIATFGIEQLKKNHPHVHSQLKSLQVYNQEEGQPKSLVDQYLGQIQNLNSRLEDKEKLINQIGFQLEKHSQMGRRDQEYLKEQTKLIRKLSRENLVMKKENGQLNQRIKILENAINSLEKTKSYEQEKSFSKKEFSGEYGNLSFDTSRDDSFSFDDSTLEVQPEMEEHRKNNEQLESQFENLKSQLEQKQDFLQKMTSEQISLEYQLIAEMKHEYHHKIAFLEREKESLLKYTQNNSGHTVSQKDKTKYMNRIEGLEGELKDFRKKSKQQKNLEKLVSAQNVKIRELAQQIKKSKVQRIELSRKIKEDKDEFEKFKATKIKDLILSKKQVVKKDRHIRKIEMEHSKIIHNNIKKQEEMKRVKKANQSLKSIIKSGMNSSSVISGGLQKHESSTNIAQSHHVRIKDRQHARDMNKSYKVPSTTGHNSAVEKQLVLQEIPDREADELISESMKRILLMISRASDMEKYGKRSEEIQGELEDLLNEDAACRLKVQRLKVLNSTTKTTPISNKHITQQEIQTEKAEKQIEISELTVRIQDLNERIQNSEENLEYCREKVMILMEQSTENMFDLDSEILLNRKYQGIESFRKLIKALFLNLESCLQNAYKTQEEVESRKGEIQQRKIEIEILKEQIASLNTQHRQSLSSLREEMMSKYYREEEFDEQTTEQQRKIRLAKTMDEKERLIYESKISQLSKTKKQQSSEIEKMKKQIGLLQAKYEKTAKQMLSFSKMRKNSEMILHHGQQGKKVEKVHRQNEQMKGEINDLIEGLSRKQISSMVPERDRSKNRDKPKLQELQEMEEEFKCKWDCIGKIEGHGSSISTLAAHTNILVSGGSKNLKIWDLETSKIISDLSGIGNIRNIIISEERRMMLAAVDKNIVIWDLTTLQTEVVLKGHKDEIRALNIDGNLLFSGGKGTANSYGLLAWDLRKLESNQPISELERNQDIHCMTSHKDCLYYGGKPNSDIRRLNCHRLEVLSTFQPPHNAIITSLSIYQGMLLSASKDKMLKTWSLGKNINNLTEQVDCRGKTDENYINTIQSDSNFGIFYTGGKDGSIKAGFVNPENQKIEFLAKLSGHTQAINSICPLDDPQNSSLIASGSSDKIIRLWRPAKETLHFVEKIEI